MDKMRCHICSNYLHGIDTCKFCSFEYDDNLPWTNDCDWDLLALDEDAEWSFLQIQYRLKAKKIDCLQVIDWYNGDDIILFGIREMYPDNIAQALGVYKESISLDPDIGICIINIFKERILRDEEK